MKTRQFESRRPKAETRKKAESRNPKSEGSATEAFSDFGFRLSAFFRVSAFGLRTPCLLALFLLCAPSSRGAVADALFRDGTEAYRAGENSHAAIVFREAARQQPASGTLQNLGNAQWRLGQTGLAVLAWEQALWLDPFNEAARNNLRFARKAAQIETPDLTWYEVVSTWLPVNWWAWIAGLSFWLAVGTGTLPGILRLRKAVWHQAVAALGLAIFLLSLPAHFGVATRCRLGFVLEKDTLLRLTPTLDAQAITRLTAGEPARLVRARGRFLLVRTHRALGWIEQDQFGLVCPGPKPKA